MEVIIHSLAEQLADLALVTKRTSTAVSGPSEIEKTCSYCQKPGHFANRCPENSNRNTRCARCGKHGHLEETCWSKVSQNDNRNEANKERKVSESVNVALIKTGKSSRSEKSSHNRVVCSLRITLKMARTYFH